MHQISALKMTTSQQGKIDNKNKPGHIVSEGVKQREVGESSGEGLGEVSHSPLQGVMESSLQR